MHCFTIHLAVCLLKYQGRKAHVTQTNVTWLKISGTATSLSKALNQILPRFRTDHGPTSPAPDGAHFSWNHAVPGFPMTIRASHEQCSGALYFSDRQHGNHFRKPSELNQTFGKVFRCHHSQNLPSHFRKPCDLFIIVIKFLALQCKVAIKLYRFPWLLCDLHLVL